MSAPLSATQRQVLGDLAAGGRLVGRWNSTAYYCFPADTTKPSYTVTFATKHALAQGRGLLIERVPHSYPQEYRITAAGQRAWAALAPPEVPV